jgi:NAD(P)-dependent dehydrogenase (short-subunit alcohol dehydrogenase family)
MSHDLTSLRNRVVLITGGFGHLGSALATTFLNHGSYVVTTDIKESPTTSVLSRSETDVNERHLHLTVDLLDLPAVAEIPSKILSVFGQIDVVICGAAFMGTSASEGWNVPFEEQDESMWADVLTVNLTSNFTLLKKAAPALMEGDGGSVILIGSIYSSLAAQPALYDGLEIDNPAGYAVSKAGLTQLARWLSTVMAPGVRVNAVSPGGVFRSQNPEFVRRYEERTPLARMASEEDIVGPVLFLASDLANYITGHNLVVDGGFSVW